MKKIDPYSITDNIFDNIDSYYMSTIPIRGVN